MTVPQPLLRRGTFTNSGPTQTTQSMRRAFSKVSAVSILSRIVQGLDSTQAVNASVSVSVRESGSNALDLLVPLRDENLASIVILANVLSYLRIGLHLISTPRASPASRNSRHRSGFHSRPVPRA